MTTRNFRPRPPFAFVPIAVFIAGLAASASGQSRPAKIASFEELAKATAAVRAEAQARPAEAALSVELARLLMMDGKLDEAEQSLGRALEAEPNRVSSLVLLGKLRRIRYQFDKLDEAIVQAKAAAPEDPEVRLLEAAFAADKMDFAAAKAIYADLAARDPKSAAAAAGQAEVAYWENRYPEAEAFIGQCLAADPDGPAASRAYFLQSLIHRIRQENDRWAEAGRKAVAADPFDADARANLANILMRGEKKLDEGYAEAKIALRINPYDYLAHNYIGNGWTPAVYKDDKIEGDAEKAARLAALVKAGNEALLGRSYDRAQAAFSQVLAAAPTNLRALLGQGTVAYQQGDYDAALAWFMKLLAADPDYGLGHYGVAQSLLRKKDRINVRFGEIEKRFAAVDAPEPPYLRDVFTNYAKLDPDLQKIIRLSVKPLRAFLKTAKDKGATFYITPFHLRQSEAPGMERIKDSRTFDLRLWDDVKGLGGRNALSGEDWERDVKYLRYNVVAHEFTHQVHVLVPPELREEIKALFAKAKAERKTLDFYADFNEMEYFATGVEAYVSEEKLADQKIAYGHTRRELRERDPDLCRLIERLDRKDS